MVGESRLFRKDVPINKAVAEGVDFCSSSLYPKARQALPLRKSFTVASLRLAFAVQRA